MRNEECKEERKYQIERENKYSKSMVIGMNRKDIKEEKVDVSKSYYFSNKEWKDIESKDYVEKEKEDESGEKVCIEEVNEEVSRNVNEKDNKSNEEGSKEEECCEKKDEGNVNDDNVKESSVKENEKKKEKEDEGVKDGEDMNNNENENKKEKDVNDDIENQEEEKKDEITNKEEEKIEIINDKEKEEKKEKVIINDKVEKENVVDDKKDIVVDKEEKKEIVVNIVEKKEELHNDNKEDKNEVINNKEKAKNDIETLHEKEAVIIIEDKQFIPQKDLIIELDSPKKENKTYTNIICPDKEDNEFINIDLPITDNKKPKHHNSIIIEDKKHQTNPDTTNKEENKIIVLDTPSPKKQNDIIILESPNDQQDKQNSPPHKENNQVLILDSPPIQSKTFIKPTSPKNKDNQDTLNKLNKTSIVDNNNVSSSDKNKIKQNTSTTTQENQNEYQFIDLSAIEKQFDPDDYSNKNDIKETETNNNNTSKLISPVPSSSQAYPSLNASAFKSIDPNTSTFQNINKIDTNPPIQVATIPLLNPYQNINTNTNTNTNPSPPLYQEIKNISSYPDQNHPIICGNNTNNTNNNEATSNNKVNISKILNEHYFPEPKAADINYLQNQIPPPGISNLNSTSNVLNFYMNLMDNVDEVASSSPPTTFNYYQIKEISEVSDLVSSYKLYEISYINNKTKQREIKCFRRYDNFFHFHQKVKKKYPTIIIPKLPPKNPLAKIIKLQDSFFEKRRLQLIFYLNFICKHPGLNKTKELFKFLTDAEFDVNYFKVTQDDEPIPPSSLSTYDTIMNTFYLKWNSISAGTKARYIPNEENLLKKYETHFQNILKRYQDVQCSITEYLQSVIKENKEYENMSSVFDFLKESFINVNNSKQNLIKYSKHCETVSKTTYEETMNIEKLDNKLNAVISLNEGICDSLKNYCSFVERFENVLKLKEIATKNKWDKMDVILNEYDACLNHKGMLEKSLVKDTGDYIKLFDDFTSQIFDEFKMILIRINNKNTEDEK